MLRIERRRVIIDNPAIEFILCLFPLGSISDLDYSGGFISQGLSLFTQFVECACYHRQRSVI